MKELEGWLLDIYAGSQSGVTLWLIGEDGQRHCLQQAFPVTFYAAGPSARLRALWRYLQGCNTSVVLARSERHDLFVGQARPVLAVELPGPAAVPAFFEQVAQAFPELSYFDADIPLPLRYAARHQLFPLARCRLLVDEDWRVHEAHPLDSPWDLDPVSPPLRLLQVEMDADPARQSPQKLFLRAGSFDHKKINDYLKG